MVRIIITAHGEFAPAVLKSAEMITGPIEGITAVPFHADEGMDSLKEKIRKVIEEYKDNEILVITDLKGGTPCNVSFLLSKEYKISLITGLNLPMLLEASFSKDTESSASALGEKLLEAGSFAIEKVL